MILLFSGTFLILAFFLLSYIKKVEFLESEKRELNREIKALTAALKRERDNASLLN